MHQTASKRILLHRSIWIVAFAVLGFLLVPVDAEAVIAFRIVGSLIGSYFGPVGSFVGGMIGGLIGELILGSEKGPTIRGPRLADKTAQSAAFGAHVHHLWGTDRIPAQIIFSSPLKEKKHKTEIGGKGGGGPSSTGITYTYSVDIILSFGDRATGVKRIWADTKLIYDVTENDIKKIWAKEGRKFVVRDGNEAQLPSALEESYHGVGNVSAHRGLFCLEAEDFQLANFANRIPNFTAEVFTDGESTFGVIASYVPPDPPSSWWIASWGLIDEFGDVWAMYYPHVTRFPYPGFARIFHWTLDRPTDPIEEFHPLWSLDVVQTSSISNSIRLRSDEHSAAAFGTNFQGIALSYFQLELGGRIDVLSADIGVNPGVPRLAVKYEDFLYVVFEHGDPSSQPTGYMILCSALSGSVLNFTTVIIDELGGVYSDMGRSESYLWIMGVSKIIKVHPETFAVEDEIDIGSIPTVRLAMRVISDDECRIVTASQSGTRFWILRTGQAPILDAHAPNTTYASKRAFGRWTLNYVGGVYVVSFDGFVGGFEALIDFFGPGGSVEGVPLWKIVRDINIMAGADSTVGDAPPTVGDINVTQLTDIVHGYTLTRPLTARDALIQLQQTYFFACRERDLKLEYVKLGAAPVKSLPGSQLAARSSINETLPDRLTQSWMRESELPLRVHVVYNNHLNSYQPGHEYAPRLITDARSTTAVEISVAITPTEARQIADTHLAAMWLNKRSFQLRTTRRHARIDAADSIEVVIDEEAS